MRHKIIGPRWKLMIIISNIFLTLNTMVFGGEKIRMSTVTINFINKIFYFKEDKMYRFIFFFN